MEGRRRINKEKSSVLGLMIVLCILLTWQLVIGGCKSWVLQPIRIEVKFFFLSVYGSVLL
jgi:hypothetical protein